MGKILEWGIVRRHETGSLCRLPPRFSFKGTRLKKGNGTMLDRDHVSAITDSARATLPSARAFLNATRVGKGTPTSNTLYRKWECNIADLRRRMTAAGYFNLPHRLFSTAEEQEAYDALRTLAKVLGEAPPAALVASAPPPLPDEASAALLAEVVTALEGFLPSPLPDGIEWTPPDSPQRWAKLFDFSDTTLKRRFKDGRIRHKKLSSKRYQIAVEDLPAIHQPKFRNAQKPPAK
jgi:hypothetical protein